MPMNNIRYYVSEAVKTAKSLRKKLLEANSTYENGRTAFLNNEGAASWEIRTPVYEPINSHQEHNLITLASHEVYGNTRSVLISMSGEKSESLGAYCKRYDDHAEIVITEHNYCGTRYYLCKELLHLFLHDDNNITTSVSDLKTLITDLLEFPNILLDGKENAPIAVEHAAYFGAIELLIPSDYVPSLILAREEMIQKETHPGKENYEIAIKLGVPEMLVEFRLSDKNQPIFDMKD